MNRKPTPAEKAMLDLILQKVRRAKRAGISQISITIDPWTTGSGFNIWVSESCSGFTYQCDERGKAQRYRP